MIIIVGFVVVLLTVPLAGGHLAGITGLRLRATWVAVLAIVVQTLLTTTLESTFTTDVAQALHLGTYVLAGAFFVVNRRVPGMMVVGGGGGLNAIAIVANGGVMPASRWAVRTAGIVVDPNAFENSRALAHPRLLAFGDVMAIPARFPFANVFSVGDVVLLVGTFLVLHHACDSRLALHRRERDGDAVEHRGAGQRVERFVVGEDVRVDSGPLAGDA